MLVKKSDTFGVSEIARNLVRSGHAVCPRSVMLPLMGKASEDEWASFATSWEELPQDSYMADSGRYRRRRFAAFAVHGDKVTRKPHQPHYQSRDHNWLNGGVNRWFEPVDDVIAIHIVTRRLLDVCTRVFDATTPRPGQKAWHVEMHQFRIEANKAHAGYPTPEGIHRDGVSWVCVMLVSRHNISGGVTKVRSRESPLITATLREPLDALFLDDERLLHGVTPIYAQNANSRAFRDVLVLTFRENPSALETSA